jgi:endonuclease/exonuclease/phosphatase family metal-dependent hydrolase
LTASRILAITTAVLTTIVATLALLIYSITYHPAAIEPADLQCQVDAPAYDPSSALRVMTYNVQYFAGKGYVFYYDLPDNTGPDLRPSAQSVTTTLDGIARVITEGKADIVFLQEIHDNAAATDHRDELAELLQRLPPSAYPCYSQAWYWKADYVPHPKINGSVGMKLVTLSRYRLSSAIRHQLPTPPMDIVSSQFYLKRAVLASRLAVTAGPEWTLFNTHLDAFAQGSDTMQRQVAMLAGLLQQEDIAGRMFVLGGDLNLLPPGALESLADSQHYLYQEPSELKQLMNQWPSVPAQGDMHANPARWFTHFPNDTDVSGPDRTIDYLFFSHQINAENGHVENTAATTKLSDHLPIFADFQVFNSQRE